MSYDGTFKVLMVGHKEANKTALINRLISGLFKLDSRMTIGVDFYTKAVEYKGKKVKLQIWDVGGEERFRFLMSTYCRGTNVGMFVYDINNPLTLEGLSEWAQTILKYDKEIPIGLVGMKDLESDIKISPKKVLFEEGVRLAKNHELSFFTEVSPKTGENVEECFEFLTEFLLLQYGILEEIPSFHKSPTPSPLPQQEIEKIKKRDQEWIQFEMPIKSDTQINHSSEISKQIDSLLEEYEEWEIFSIVHLEKNKIINFRKKLLKYSF